MKALVAILIGVSAVLFFGLFRIEYRDLGEEFLRGCIDRKNAAVSAEQRLKFSAEDEIALVRSCGEERDTYCKEQRRSCEIIKIRPRLGSWAEYPNTRAPVPR